MDHFRINFYWQNKTKAPIPVGKEKCTNPFSQKAQWTVCVLSFLHPVSPLSVIPKPFSFPFSCTVIHVMILLRNRFQVAQMRMLIDAVRYFLKQMEIQCLAYLQEKLLGKNSIRRTIWHSLLTTNLLQGRRTLRLPIYQREDTDTTYITEWPSTTTTDPPILFQKQKSKNMLIDI